MSSEGGFGLWLGENSDIVDGKMSTSPPLCYMCPLHFLFMEYKDISTCMKHLSLLVKIFMHPI
jgi:hypothetical protein